MIALIIKSNVTMKAFQLLHIVIIVAFILLGCDRDKSEEFPTEIIQQSNVSDSLFQIFLDDAMLICLNHYNMEEKSELNSIDIDESHVGQIVAALQFVHLDSIHDFAAQIRDYNIHSLCPEQLYETTFKGDTLNENMLMWSMHGFTNDSKLNYLIDEYHLQIDSIGKSQYSIFTPNAINQNALAYELNEYDFISNASSANCIGDGSQIEIVEFYADYIHLIYSYGWGDCHSGCISRHYWELGIYGSGFVELINETGDKLPD